MKKETMKEDSEDKAATYGIKEKAEGVKIPEEFQSSVHSFLYSCNDRACLDYIAQCVSEKRMEMDKEGDEETMDTEGMPEE